MNRVSRLFGQYSDHCTDSIQNKQKTKKIADKNASSINFMSDAHAKFRRDLAFPTTVCIEKDVPNTKSLLNSFFCKIMDSDSNQGLIWDFSCASKSISFSHVEVGFKMHNFQVACANNFQPKNEFFLRWQQIWNGVINLLKLKKNST